MIPHHFVPTCSLSRLYTVNPTTATNMVDREIEKEAKVPASSSSSHSDSANATTPSSEKHPKDEERAPPPRSTVASKIPAWITSNIKDPHSLKQLFRCWLASWSCLILILPQASLAVIGQAAFFGEYTIIDGTVHIYNRYSPCFLCSSYAAHIHDSSKYASLSVPLRQLDAGLRELHWMGIFLRCHGCFSSIS
jgi:hypothetical protein